MPFATSVRTANLKMNVGRTAKSDLAIPGREKATAKARTRIRIAITIEKPDRVELRGAPMWQRDRVARPEAAAFHPIFQAVPRDIERQQTVAWPQLGLATNSSSG